MRYICENCNIKTNDKTKFERHLKTLKHNKIFKGYIKNQYDYECKKCNKKFKTIFTKFITVS